MQCGAASTDDAQCPAHTFLDEIAVVGSGALDQRQAFDEGGVVRVLVMHAQGGNEGESGAAFEFRFALCPRRDLGPGVRRFVEEMKAGGVTPEQGREEFLKLYNKIIDQISPRECSGQS